ncbi:trypsin-1-like isoform X1 [Bactrocera neohumeralis]|uniref:trypsin-1-like isoform X1 n=1 Tax=Bactrocera tryoni TaxID=59916 RepID=UPI001A99A91C|nr:trypsin-1-like isoform X1 [Bactrocera tryoni]XP_050333260.1 trypsin-1-like isoform X1 [Bactrocera neohumeralis]
MWPGRVSKDSLFYATILTVLAISVFCNRSVNACYEYQYCLTPLNYSGRYMEDETYGDMPDKAKMLCDGFCHHNSTLRLRCCAYDATVKLERISEQVCTYNHLIRGFVIHGEIAKDNEFPFMAALGWRIKNETTGNTTIVYKCGGTIYDRGYVITAAHCLYHSSELPVVVRPGGFALNDTEAWDLEIEEIIEHPNYEYPNVYNDIAIIRLKTIFYGNPFHDQPACLYDDPSSAHNVTAIGYGNTQFAGVSSPLLMKTNLSTIDNSECQLHYEPDSDVLSDGIISTQICAKDHEKLRDTCQGDSGGPIIKFIKPKDLNPMSLVVGITSFGIGCGTGMPSVYTRISEYIDWIENVTYRTVPI